MIIRKAMEIVLVLIELLFWQLLLDHLRPSLDILQLLKMVMNIIPRKLVWEAVLLWRRLVLLTASIFIVDTILKLYPVGVLLVLFCFHDYIVRPFTDHMLNVFQIVSYGLLIVLALINSFWAFPNNLDLTSSDNPTFHTLGQFLLYFELFILLFPSIVFIGWFLRKVFVKIYKSCLCKQD